MKENIIVLHWSALCSNWFIIFAQDMQVKLWRMCRECKLHFMTWSCSLPCNIVQVTTETAGHKSNLLPRSCECSVSLWLLDYADLTIMLAVSHGQTYANHRVSDTDTKHCYPGTSHSLWAHLRGETALDDIIRWKSLTVGVAPPCS